ncbi:MAG TPA: hypothetical protein DDY78_16290 [Planctomycetales bacterium]|jgi:hypothetical protein|nr:hypothetical protein [Planctomycetales bacterium]
MKQELNNSELLWGRLVEAELNASKAFRAFFSEGVDRVPWVRHGLRFGGMGRSAALRFFSYLTPLEQQQLFPDLVFMASWGHGSVGFARELILSMPRDRVLNNIEREAEPLLQEGTYDEYRRFLELYEQLDPAMTQRLARRAAAHSDPDIREAGEDFLVKCEPAVNAAAT